MIVSDVGHTIVARQLFQKSDRVIVACSGGGDSVALLVVLAELASEWSIEVHAACVDHGLRAEAAQEVELVRALATRLGVSFHALRVSVSQDASLQAAARAARYEALLNLRDALGGGVVATGHTRDDQAETVLARMLRGAGLRGLGAIAPRRADGVVRPLIDVEREPLRAFLRERGIAWAEDPSNESLAFERVRIRKQVLPSLRAEQPDVSTMLAALADEARDADAALDAQAVLALAGMREGHDLRSAALAALPDALVVRVLRQWLAVEFHAEPSGVQLAALIKLTRSRRGHVRMADGLWIEVHAQSGLLVGQLRTNEPGRGRSSRGS